MVNGRAPFVNTPPAVIPEIVSALHLTSTSVVYDLGCGDGKILLAAYKDCPQAKFIGIDISVFAYLFAKMNVAKANAVGNVKILKGDFHKLPIAEATHVYTWLSKPVMDSLLPKFEKELAKGTRMVCLDFPFSNKVSIDKIAISASTFGHTLYIYEF